MSPVKDRGRGTLVVDRMFPKFGRIKRASGTSDAKTYKKMLAMLDLLVDKGRLDLIEGWAEGYYPLLDLYNSYRTDTLDGLPNPETVQRLWRLDDKGKEVGALEVLFSKWTKSGAHLRSMRTTFARLRELSPVKDGDPTARVADLVKLLEKYREVCRKAGHATSFNLARSHVMAVAKKKAGKDGSLHKAAKAVERLPVVKKPRRVGDIETATEGRALELAEVFRVHEALAKAGPAYAALWRTMVCTGMGPTDVNGPWFIVMPDGRVPRVRIGGTKRVKRMRTVPYLAAFGPLERPGITMRQFSAVLLGASGGEAQPYDARRTFSHLCALAGIPRARKNVYMGHESKDVADLYEAHQIETYLEQDAAALQAYIERTLARQGITLPPPAPAVATGVEEEAVEEDAREALAPG